MDSVTVDWLDVVSNFSDDTELQQTLRDAASICSAASPFSFVSRLAADHHAPPLQPPSSQASTVESPRERQRKQMQGCVASPVRLNAHPSEHGSPRVKRSSACFADMDSISEHCVQRATTLYRENSRSFCTLEVSQSIAFPHVVETLQVVVRKNDSCETINDYLVLDLLGFGSYGRVHLVESIKTGERFAMKTIQVPGTKTNDKRRTALRREIAVMKRMAHPNMVQLREVLGDINSRKLYLVLQHISGGSIARKMTNFIIAPIEEQTLRRQARQLVSALKYMHVNGVVHRDIKPDNILVDEHQQAYLSDFGVSAVCTEEGVSGIEGTPAFMAPEVCRGDAEVRGHLVDVWALGVSLFQLMYGVLPFIAFNVMDLTRSILADSLVFPDEDATRWDRFVDEFGLPAVRPSDDFKELMRGMLTKDPAERWGVRKIIGCKWFDGLGCYCVDDSTHSDVEDFWSMLEVSHSELAGAIVPADIMYI